MVLDRAFLQEYPFNTKIIGLTLFLLYISDLDNVSCNITFYADDTILYSKCDQVPDL